MTSLGLQMLRHDRAKFISMILAVAMASFLMQNQASILAAFLGMSGSQIRDVREADLWVMEQDTECFDQVKPMRETALGLVRGVEGVLWAEPLQKLDTTARTDDQRLRAVTILGVDGATRVGEPRMKTGSVESIYERTVTVVDPGGWGAQRFVYRGPRRAGLGAGDGGAPHSGADGLAGLQPGGV
jgi:putative ABC transport system permease protein